MNIIDKQYEEIKEKLKGGMIFGEEISTPKHQIVASYYMGKSEGSEEANESHKELLKSLGY